MAHSSAVDNAVVLVDPDSSQPALLGPLSGPGAVERVHVMCKLKIGILDDLEVCLVQIDHSIRLQNSLVTVALSFVFGEGQGRLTGIADLTAIPACLWVFVVVLGCKAADTRSVNVDDSVLFCEAVFDHGQVVVEDFESVSGV